MANHKTKLELTWIGKENRPRLEPRILIEDPAKSYHAPFRVGDKDLFDNRLIFGGNLLALKALEQEFAGYRNQATPAIQAGLMCNCFRKTRGGSVRTAGTRAQRRSLS